MVEVFPVFDGDPEPSVFELEGVRVLEYVAIFGHGKLDVVQLLHDFLGLAVVPFVQRLRLENERAPFAADPLGVSGRQSGIGEDLFRACGVHLGALGVVEGLLYTVEFHAAENKLGYDLEIGQLPTEVRWQALVQLQKGVTVKSPLFTRACADEFAIGTARAKLDHGGLRVDGGGSGRGGSGPRGAFPLLHLGVVAIVALE